MKKLIIVAILAIAGIVTWQIVTHVDRSKPEQVAAAFVKALKSHNVDRAAKYWVPESADAWNKSATEKLNNMQTGTHTRFFEDLPDGSTPWTVSPRNPKMAANEQTMTSNGANLDLRQIDGKWYVCRAMI